MATIRSAIQIQDGMSPAFKAMYTAMNLVLNTFESIQSASNNTIDTTSIQAAREELAKANVVASEFQDQLTGLNSTSVNVNTPQNTNNDAQRLFDDTVERGQIKDNLVNNISSQQQYNELLENTKRKLEEMRQTATDISNITGEDKNLLMANNSEYQKMVELQSVLLQNEQEIKDSISSKMPEWKPTDNIQVFTDTGIERYKQEINSANSMIQQLSSSQQKIQNQAQNMDLLPNNAINDINSLNSRIERIKTTLQEVQARRITGIGADRASSQVETLRQQLNDAIESQNNLTNAMDNMDITATNEAYQQLVNNIDSAERNIRDNINSQNQFNGSINTGVNSADNLSNKFKSILATLASIIGIMKVLNLADDISQTTARLDLIVDDGGSVAELENKIFASADRARGAYLDTSNVISKLGILAGDNFKNTDEIIAFTELMNKNFKISGASIQEQTAGMYQLTQAMASGKLQGDEFRSIMENAPLLAEAIADYTGKSKGELKELSSEGLITADVIKNAMFAAADETNARFEKMPMTFSDAWTKMKNIALKAFQPVLTKISSFVNTPEVQSAFESFVNVVSLMAQAVLELINMAIWLYDILEPFTPLILGIVGAYVAFNAAKLLYTTITGIAALVTGVLTAAQALHAGATLAEAAATTTATGAQVGLNAAMLACPAVWIAIIILALIVALTYLWFTNDKVAYALLYLWDALKLGIMVAGLGIQAVWYGLQLAVMYLWLGVQTCVLGMMTAWYGFQTGVEAVCLGVLSIFQGLYNGIVSIVNGIINVLNKIPGVEIDTVEAASFANDFAGKMANNIIDRNAKLQEMASQMDGTMDQINEMKSKFGAELSTSATNIQNKAIEMNTTRQDRVDHRNDWVNDASSAIKNALNTDGFDFNSMGSDLGNTLGDISGDTSKISDSLDVTEDDLQYLRDLAEQEVINRFTTAEINIEMNNNNNINGEQDLDGIVEYLEDKLYETMEVAAEGVHD